MLLQEQGSVSRLLYERWSTPIVLAVVRTYSCCGSLVWAGFDLGALGLCSTCLAECKPEMERALKQDEHPRQDAL